jgi:hypothetical protein
MGSRGRSSSRYRRELTLTDDDKNHIVDRHRASSQYQNKTKFPENWTDADILDAVERTIDMPDRVAYPIPPNDRYQIEKDIFGITIRVSYYHVDGKAVMRSAYPL